MKILLATAIIGVWGLVCLVVLAMVYAHGESRVTVGSATES